MTFRNWVTISAVLPLLERNRYAGVGERLRHYKRQESMPLVEALNIQWQTLMRLLHHAYNTTEFYRERFQAAGLQPSDIKSPSDLTRIPVLTREDIRSHLPSLRSKAYRQNELHRAATGGTTDTPVEFLRDGHALKEKVAVQVAFGRWAEYLPGDKVLFLWGARSDYAESPSWRWRLYDEWLLGNKWAPTSVFNESVMEQYRTAMNGFRPKVLYAYPTPAALFCEYLRDSGLPYVRPKTVICTAERLEPQQRQLIESVLNVRVFEQYGSREFGIIASECERHCGLHINPAAAFIELCPFDTDDSKDLRELVVTDLLNYGMPLIRYKVNDCTTGTVAACDCGRGYPVIGPIAGRTTDVFRLADGSVVPGVALTNRVLQVCPGLKRTQFIQETLQDFRVKYVPGPDFSAADLERLRKRLLLFFPEGLNWIFEEVQEIEREKSGKTRFCISRVTANSSLASMGNEREVRTKDHADL
jgi:phenylacetate-CoA ligase